jgi:membrane-associated phospholipid phosphatase
MKNLTKTILQRIEYFRGYLIFLGFLSFYCLITSKSNGFLLINRFHTTPMDYFFIMFTNLGNGLFAIGLMILMAIRKKFAWSFQIGISFLISGLLAQLLKFMTHSPRPMLYFGPGLIHYFHGITRTGYGSFPSGHTATIFAITTLLSFYFKGKNAGLLFITIAVLTGFSRIYLAQHFPVDVLAGSLIGVFTSVFVYLWLPSVNFHSKNSGKRMVHQSVKLHQQ